MNFNQLLYIVSVDRHRNFARAADECGIAQSTLSKEIQRLEKEFRRAQGGSAEAMLFSILGAVQDFAAPRALTDDMTLVIIRNTTSERM